MLRFDTVSPEVMEAMCTPMHQILAPHGDRKGTLYLGSLAAVLDKDVLRERRILNVVQVIDGTWIPLSKEDGFNTHQIEIMDQSSADLRPYLEAACNYIDHALRSGKNVLVHCHQGVSRSPSVVIAYLIRNLSMSFDNAFSFVQKQRPCVKPNSGFITTLRDWESTSTIGRM